MEFGPIVSVFCWLDIAFSRNLLTIWNLTSAIRSSSPPGKKLFNITKVLEDLTIKKEFSIKLWISKLGFSSKLCVWVFLAKTYPIIQKSRRVHFQKRTVVTLGNYPGSHKIFVYSDLYYYWKSKDGRNTFCLCPTYSVKKMSTMI